MCTSFWFGYIYFYHNNKNKTHHLAKKEDRERKTFSAFSDLDNVFY